MSDEVRPKTAGLLFVLAVLCSTLAAPIQARELRDVHPYLTDKYFLDLGVYFPDRTLKIRVDGTVPNPNTDINFEKGLRAKRNDETFALNLGWRFGEKWSVLSQYFKSSGGAEAVLQEDVEWKDDVFAAGTSVAAGQEFTLLRVFFGRALDSGDRHDFGVGAGIHWLEFSAFVEGNLILGSGGGAFRRESVTAKGPLPNFGVWYQYSLAPKWALRSRLDWLDVSFGDYDGRLINASFGLNYQALDHIGIGLNYNLFELDVDVTKPDWHGDLETTYEGLYAYLSFYW